jgi:multiple sugar transport system permease protein
MNKHRLPGQIVLLVVGLVVSLLVFFPILLMLTTSLKPVKEMFNNQVFPSLKTITLYSYHNLFASGAFVTAVSNSFIVAASVTLFGLIFHSMSGFALAKLRFPGKNAVFTWVLSTLMVPFAVIMLPLFLLIRSLGLSNTLTGMILPAIPNAYGIFLFRQFMLGLPTEIIESGRMDGASFFRIYFSLVLPLTKSIMVALGMAIFMGNWNSYLWPLLVSQGPETAVIQLFIAALKSAYTTDWPTLFAASCVASFPPILIFALIQRHLVESNKLTGIKG